MAGFVGFPLLLGVGVTDTPPPVQLLAWVPVGLVLGVVSPLVTGNVPSRPYNVRLVDALHRQSTERVVLRRLRRRDADAFLATIDEVVVTTNGWEEGAREEVAQGLRVWGHGRIVDEVLITDRRSRAVIGSMSIQQIDEEARTCELGWNLGPEWRGRGYGTEAVRLAVQALHGAGIREIRVGTNADNLAVQRVVEKLGARPLDNTQHVLPNGTTIESLWYAFHPLVGSP